MRRALSAPDHAPPAQQRARPRPTLLVANVPRRRRAGACVCVRADGSGRTELNKPWGLCLLEGHLLIVDRNNHRLVLTTVAGRHVRTIGGAGLAPGRFRYPCAACVAHGSWFEKPSALA